MNFEQWLNQAWDKHATDAKAVANEISNGQSLITQAEQIPQLSRLIVHIYGEHLKQIDSGLEQLANLKKSDFAKAWSHLEDGASLELQKNEFANLEKLSPSGQAKALAVAASALAANLDIQSASKFLKQAESISESLDQSDPAHRSLAISGNNLACALEETANKSDAQIALMIEAAKLARKFWEIAGTWLHVERAEYRLAKTFLSAKQANLALQHALLGLQICEKNQAEALEFFFTSEVLIECFESLGKIEEANREKQKMREAYEGLSESDKSWCKNYLK